MSQTNQVSLSTELVSNIPTPKNSKLFNSILSSFGDLMCGSIAGMVSKVIEHPFDTIKVRLQTQTQYSGPLDCFKSTIKNEGVNGLFRGLPAPMLASMMENAVLFLAYNHCQQFIKKVSDNPQNQPLSIPQLALAGGLAGTFTSLVLTPFELIKCRVQVANLSTQNYSNLNGAKVASNFTAWSMLTHTLKHDGIRVFYRGHTGTAIREIGGSVAYFGTYEFICKRFVSHQQSLSPGVKITKDDLKPRHLMAAGAMAGVFYNFLFFPVDCIKSRMQTSAEKLKFVDTARSIYTHLGVKGFYRGCLITCARAMPSNALIFLIYETLSSKVKAYLN